MAKEVINIDIADSGNGETLRSGGDKINKNFTELYGAVALNTAKVTNISHPLVETAVPSGALFTDTEYTLPFQDNSENWDTAYNRGDHSGLYEDANGNIQSHISSNSNPHSVDKSDVGLSNVPNTDFTTAVNLNTSKTGITTQQAADIETNNAKVSGEDGEDGEDGADGNAIIGINNQTGTTYTLVLTDAGKYIRCNNASAITLTVPPNSSVAFELGTVITIEQQGSGIITAAEGSGVTLNGELETAAQYACIQLVKVATDVWTVIGGATA